MKTLKLTSSKVLLLRIYRFTGISSGSDGKASDYNVGDLGSIPGLGRSSGEGNGNPLQYSCLENPMDGGAWWATVPGVAKSQTRQSDFIHSLTYRLKNYNKKHHHHLSSYVPFCANSFTYCSIKTTFEIGPIKPILKVVKLKLRGYLVQYCLLILNHVFLI